jgi:serine/threonine-protein kinase HipA
LTFLSLTANLPGEAAAEVLAVIEVVNTWQAHFSQTGMSVHDIKVSAQ